MFDFPVNITYDRAISVVRKLNSDGHEAYLVGGCVRDCLLKREITDYDICTSALPEEIVKGFPNHRDTGIAYGTVTVVLEGDSFEVTTFRGEGTYSDGRRPDSVVFGVSLEEDLKRRDFTINAMAYHPDFGLIDPFQGEIHLKERSLVTVGVAYQRFSEDYLRILRGLRFSATLGLEISGETGDAMLACAQGLNTVTRERVTNEVKKMVMGDYLHLLADYYPVLEDGIFYGVDCLWEADELQQFVEKLLYITKSPKLLSLRLALFLALFYPDCAFLRLSNAEIKEVNFLCQQTCLAWEKPEVFHKLIQKQGRDKVNLLLIYQKYHFPYHRFELDAMELELSEKTCTSLAELSISAQDLMDAGVQQGEMLGKLLQIALQMVISGEVENEKEAILSVIFGENKTE